MRNSAAKAGAFRSGTTIDGLNEIDEGSFRRLSHLLNTLAGINLPDNPKNRTLLSARLSPLLRQLQLPGFKEYYEYLMSNAAPTVQQQFISAMTTNTTQFFREAKHFDVLVKVLPDILAEKLRRGRLEIRVWCAAVSTGQEAYSILMTLLEHLPQFPQWTIKFLASDIDLKALQRAADGRYTKAEVAAIPVLYRHKYFSPRIGGSEGSMVVRKEFREKITFAPFNLTSASYNFQQPFDIIFCRNVLIYFDPNLARSVASQLAQSLTPGGILFVGHAETIATKIPNLSAISHAAYRKEGVR